jgi:hypothetical protein
MRRFVVLIGILMLALPAGAGALKGGPGDGTLVVEHAQGVITLAVRGGIIGRFDQGTLVVVDSSPGTGAAPIVRGYQQKTAVGPKRMEYSGEGDIRFRLIGGFYRVRISAIGIDLSVVGRGTTTLDSSGFSDDPGRFSINAAPFQSMPDGPARFTIGQPLPAPTGDK